MLSPEELLIRDTVRRFADRRVAPIAAQCDESEAFPPELVREMGELGLLGISFPEAYGGSEGSKLAFAIAVEELYHASAGIAASIYMSPLIAHDLLLSATEDQKQQLVPPLLSGEAMAALAVTEPGAGSDAGSLQTRAEAVPGGFRLNGRKTYITNGGLASFVLVAARTAPDQGNKGVSLFVVFKGAPGFIVERRLSKVGWRASDTSEMVFEDCFVPDEGLVGKLNGGFRVIMQGFNLERIVLATGSVGLAQAALDAAIRYAGQRVQFGQSIGKFQAVRDLIARMASEVEASRQLAYHAAHLMDAGLPCIREAAMAKLHASEMCQRVTRDAIQVFGGMGFMMESSVQRFHRDSLVMSIGGGTSQIQAEIIARQLGL